MFNQDAATMKFNNKKGNLKVPREELEPYINYANQGGGYWVASTFNKITKNRKRVNSAQVAASTYIDMENTQSEDDALKSALTNLEGFDETI
jgi:uncharacterized membrane protein YvbJ